MFGLFLWGGGRDIKHGISVTSDRNIKSVMPRRETADIKASVCPIWSDGLPTLN